MKPETFEDNQRVARSGGEVSGIARQEAEKRTGKPVITSKNASELNMFITDMIEGVADASVQDEK